MAKKLSKILKSVAAKKQKKADTAADKARKALHPGKRKSASGKTYYENRPNRSDKNRTKKLAEGGKPLGSTGLFENGGSVSDERIDKMVTHYAAAALWSSDDYEGNPLDDNYSISDISEKTLGKMRSDLKKFVSENADAIEKSGLSDEQVAYDFWLTRNGHGAGFFDRGLDQEIEDQLTKSAKSFKGVYLEVSDNGEVYEIGYYEEGGKPVGSTGLFGKGGEVIEIGGQKVNHKIKFGEGKQKKIGYLVIQMKQYDVEKVLLYDSSKKLVGTFTETGAKEKIKKGEWKLLKTYSLQEEDSAPSIPITEMTYGQLGSYVEENYVDKIKSAYFVFSIHESGEEIDHMKGDISAQHKEILEKHADYTEENFEEKSGGYKIEGFDQVIAPDGRELPEEKNFGFNTYNQSYLGGATINARVYCDEDADKCFCVARVHGGGDVRGNYREALIFEEQQPERAFDRLFYLINGSATVGLEFEDGSSCRFFSEQDSDVWWFKAGEDEGDEESTGIAKKFVADFKKFSRWHGDSFLDATIDRFKVHHSDKFEQGGKPLGSTMLEKGGQMSNKKIMLESILATSEEDNYNEGATGIIQIKMSERVMQMFDTPEQMFAYLYKQYGLSAAAKEYVAFEDSRLEYNRLEDAEGEEISPSDPAFQLWKKGKAKAWIAQYSIYVKHVTVEDISEKELIDNFGAIAYAADGKPLGSTLLARGGDLALQHEVKPLGSTLLAKGGRAYVERIPNSESHAYSENRIPFKGSNLEGKILDNGDYTVLSYGHYPIWYWSSKENKWYGNKDKYSNTTAVQISQSRPTIEAQMLSHSELLEKMRDEDARFDLGGIMIKELHPMSTDNTLIAHAGARNTEMQ
jgi:hypothetical protein